jgi:hypothetical protein
MIVLLLSPLGGCFVIAIVFLGSILGIDGTSEERGLKLAYELLEIPESAQDVRAYNFGEGMWRSTHVRIELPESSIHEFLSANTCFDSIDQLTLGLDSVGWFQPSASLWSSGLPDWWEIPSSSVVAGGECTTAGEVVNNIAVSRFNDRWFLYVMMIF